MCVCLSDFSHWNISSLRAETFISFTAVGPAPSTILIHSGHSVNIERTRTTCLLSFAREHGGGTTFANPLHYESFRCPVARVNSLHGQNDSDGWVPSSTVVSVTLLTNGPAAKHSQQMRGWLSYRRSYLPHKLSAGSPYPQPPFESRAFL